MENDILSIFTDGGSRGNPGIAGVGAVLKFKNETKKYSQFLGDNITNNEAEYRALIFALKKTKQLIGKTKSKRLALKCYADSELMVKQLNHEYKLSNENIQKLFIQIWNLMLDFKSVEVVHIPRKKNKEADEMANEAMDQVSNKLF
ncbi:MAG: ribonuclease HI family protein [Candidatus Moranbacteria bacterium]|nr:ribonuclease HI family protein [Candidatus Moranbacteria bacterium]